MVNDQRAWDTLCCRLAGPCFVVAIHCGRLIAKGGAFFFEFRHGQVGVLFSQTYIPPPSEYIRELEHPTCPSVRLIHIFEV